MESNGEIDSSSDVDSNSISTEVRVDRNQGKVRPGGRGNSNVVFVSPNELENWNVEEDKNKLRKSSRPRPSRASLKPKPVKQTPKPKKKRGRPKRKKEQNPWGSDDDENMGLENEVSDDEYFRRLEEASATDTVDYVQSDMVQSVDNAQQEEEEEEEEEIFIGQMKTFDFNNSDLLNHMLSEREKSLDINDPSKPQIDFPPSSIDFNCPQNSVLQLFGVYETVVQYHKILRISPFKIEDFITAMVTNENSNLLSELHMSLLKLLLREDESVNTSLCPIDQKDSVNLSFHFMDSMTWPDLLRLYIKSIDYKCVKITISEAYPFVSLHNRLHVISFLLDLFINGSSLRLEVSRENVIVHEDFCRICHLSGEVLCCDSCSAVYHLECLTPRLFSVPKTTWNCTICVKHKIPGLYDCNFDGDKALVEHKKTPLGTDRFGNTYWLLARRLIIEPRNDNIQYLADSIIENDDEKYFEPNYESVLYYSNWQSVRKIRDQLNRDWEAELCDVFDGIAEEMEKSMEITKKLTEEGLNKFKKLAKLSSEIKVLSALSYELVPEVEEMESDVTTKEEFKEDAKSESKTTTEVEIKNCILKTFSGQQVGVIEDQEGLLVRNIDGNTIRVRLSAKTRGNQLEEVSSLFNCKVRREADENILLYRLGDEGDWRFYINFFATEFEALSRNQHQEEKDRKRILGNKFSINESNDFHWFYSQSTNRAEWQDKNITTAKPVNDITGGPLGMLQCLRLTLQNMEAQMFSSFMCPAWKTERKNWLINIQRTRNASTLADFVAIFESAIRPCALKKAWSNSLGFLYLDRVTAAEREEEKRVKTVEKKNFKPDGDVVKTRNPGLLKHTIWKTKGEEFRRLGGDGWTWLNAIVSYHNGHLDDSFTIDMNISSESVFVLSSSEEETVNICGSSERVSDSISIDELYKLRTAELLKATVDFDMEDSQTKLKDLTNARNDIQTKKEKLEEQLETLSKNQNKASQWQNQTRKRMHPDSYNYLNSGEKRIKYQNENSPYMSQYDGADDDDCKSASETGQTVDNSSASLRGAPMNNNNLMKPMIINNQANMTTVPSTANMGRICVLNVGQPNAQNTNRILLNQNPQFKIVKMSNNNTTQMYRFVTPPNIQIQGKPNNAITTMPIRKINPSGQFVFVNNVTGATNTPISGVHMVPISQQNMIYANTNGVPIRLNICNQQQQQQQYKRLLPMDSSMLMQHQQQQHQQIQQRPMTSTPISNNSINQQQLRMSSTPVQGRRTISKVTNSMDNRMCTNADTNDELVQRKEMDALCNEIVTCDQQIEGFDKQIAEMQYKIEQANLDISIIFKLYRKSPIERSLLTDLDEDAMLPERNSFKWPLESKNYLRSIFIYKKECIRPLILSAGRTEVPGFEVEKKRLSNIFWPYPSSRPSLGVTWKYQVSRVVNAKCLDKDIFQLAGTEPIVDSEHDKLKNIGCMGLSALALCLKMLWYSLRWDDMLTNWQNGDGLPKTTNPHGVFKETLINGDVLERKIISWRSLDKYSSRCNYLLTICVTSNTITDTAVITKGRSNRHGRQRTAARYTDTDYFTDDGERDSEDSDPNFIPGQSRAGRSRGRRSRIRQMDEGSEIKMPDKKFKEEWMDEDMLELWEIRDYIMSVNWRRSNVSCHNYKNSVVSSILNKRVFQKIDAVPMVPRTPVVVPQNNVVISALMNPSMVPQNGMVKSSETIEDLGRKVGLENLVMTSNTILDHQKQPGSFSTGAVPLDTISKVESNPASQLIIESTSLKEEPLFALISKTKDILSSPPVAPVSTASMVPVPITDIREITRSENVATSLQRPKRAYNMSRGRKSSLRGRSTSSNNQNDDALVESKLEDISAELETGSVTLASRLTNIQQNIVERDTILALEKSDEMKLLEQVKRESKKVTKKSSSSRKESYKDEEMSEELTDHEVQTGSTSPAVDAQMYEEQTLFTDLLTKATDSSLSPRKGGGRVTRSVRERMSTEEESDVTTVQDTISSRNVGSRSVLTKTLSKKRNHSDVTNVSPTRATKSKMRKVTAESGGGRGAQEHGEMYCLCRTLYDPTRGYIGCDVCLNWFHFECVGMSEKKASTVKLWKCEKCSPTKSSETAKLTAQTPIKTAAPPILVQESKTKTESTTETTDVEIYCSCKSVYDPARLYIACDYCDEWYHPQCVGMSDDEANNYQGSYKCPSCKQSKSKKKNTRKCEPDEHVPNTTIDHEKKINSELKKKLTDLLNKMMKHRDGAPFLKAVDSKKFPRYYQVVRSPMDLGTIKSNLDKLKYPTVGSFKLDMHKIFTACRTYFDHSSREYQCCDNLETFFLTELKTICTL